MKFILIATTAAALALPAAAMAQPGAQQEARIVARDAHGRATQVQIDGQAYPVCTPQQQDACINPRDAGLKWGNRDLNYWPGQPASGQDGQ